MGPDDAAEDLGEYAELVLDMAAKIPAGQVSSYGAIAAAVRVLTGRGSARTVGAVMARHGDEVPWWRVVNAKGTLPEHLRTRAVPHWRSEGTPMTRGESPHVNMREAGWSPQL